jgi:hypothetical protein
LLPFEEARDYVHSLGFLNSVEWDEYLNVPMFQKKPRNLPELPSNIPQFPEGVYEDEWNGWQDWLGNDEALEWRDFEEARDYVRSVGLRDFDEWWEWAISDARPRDIPMQPKFAYEEEGWNGWRDWLETWRSYEEAREFVRSVSGVPRSGTSTASLVRSQMTFPGTRERSTATNGSRRYPSMTQNTKQWRGWSDWLGAVSQWDRETLLTFLEDLRPRLKDLSETELHMMLQQAGAMPALKKALPDSSGLGVIRDLKENT